MNGPFVNTIVESEIDDAKEVLKMFFPDNEIIDETNNTGVAQIGLVYKNGKFLKI